MTDKPAERTANMVHYPGKNASDPNALDEYIDAIDSSITSINSSITALTPALTSYTPTPTTNTGSITSGSSALVYFYSGDLLYIGGTITITTKGSAAGHLQIILPESLTAAASVTFGMNRFSGGAWVNSIFAYAEASQNFVRIYESGPVTPFVSDGDVFYLTGWIPTE